MLAKYNAEFIFYHYNSPQMLTNESILISTSFRATKVKVLALWVLAVL